MKTINLKSVLISGFIAGAIMIISAFSMIPAVGNDMDEALANRGLPPLSSVAMAYFTFVSIVNGIFLVFLYTLLKPHLISKVKTAIVSALLVWFFVYLLGSVSMVFYGFMPVKLTVIGMVWGLGELLLASFAGVKFYKEVKEPLK